MKELKEIIANVLGIDENSVNESLSRDSESEWDSFNHLLLISEIETKLNIKFTMEDVENIKSYAQLEAVVLEKRQ
jgi:acyl carrier protein